MSRNTSKKHVDILLIWEEGKTLYVLIKDFSTLCLSIGNRKQGNNFAITVYKLLAQKKYENAILMVALKLMVKKGLRWESG